MNIMTSKYHLQESAVHALLNFKYWLNPSGIDISIKLCVVISQTWCTDRGCDVMYLKVESHHHASKAAYIFGENDK